MSPSSAATGSCTTTATKQPPTQRLYTYFVHVCIPWPNHGSQNAYATKARNKKCNTREEAGDGNGSATANQHVTNGARIQHSRGGPNKSFSHPMHCTAAAHEARQARGRETMAKRNETQTTAQQLEQMQDRTKNHNAAAAAATSSSTATTRCARRTCLLRSNQTRSGSVPSR